MTVSKSRIRVYATNIGVIIASAQHPRREHVLKRSGVLSGSYAADLVERIYHFLFGRSIDLKNEYEKYYASEYRHLKTFLREKYCLSRKWLKRLDAVIEGDGFVGLVPSTWGRDWQIESLMECDEEFDIIIKLLDVQWVENDNED